MSITKFIQFCVKNKSFLALFYAKKQLFVLSEPKKGGFWVLESLISIVIFSIMLLFLTRFSVNIAILTSRSISKMRKLEKILSKIEGGSEFDSVDKSGAINIKKIKLDIIKTNILPQDKLLFKDKESLEKKALELDDFEICCVNVAKLKLFFVENRNSRIMRGR